MQLPADGNGSIETEQQTNGQVLTAAAAAAAAAAAVLPPPPSETTTSGPSAMAVRDLVS